MAYPIRAWLDAFAFTQVVEVPVYVLAMRHALGAGRARWPRTPEIQILVAFGASAITHPMVWYVIPRVAWGSYAGYVIAAETFAVLVEAFYFRSLHIVFSRRAFVWALVANALSAGLGSACRALFGWP